jgi:hypothetical protein
MADLSLTMGSYSSRTFMRVLALILLYEEFFGLLEKKVTGRDHLKVLKLLYAGSRAHLEKPPFHILAEVLLRLCREEGSGVLLVDENTVDEFQLERDLAMPEFKRLLCAHPKMITYLDDKLKQYELIQIRVQEMVKILLERPIQVDTASLQFTTERDKKKKTTKK